MIPPFRPALSFVRAIPADRTGFSVQLTRRPAFSGRMGATIV